MCKCLATFSWQFSQFSGATPQVSPTSVPLRFLVDFRDCQAKVAKETTENRSLTVAKPSHMQPLFLMPLQLFGKFLATLQ